MKYKYIIAIFLLGAALQIYGALQKILHTSNADNWLTASSTIMISAAVIAIIKLVKTKNKDSFLNK